MKVQKYEISNFNPHSRKGSDLPHLSEFAQPCYFNPHSRKGSDASPPVAPGTFDDISIHTPARGVTS